MIKPELARGELQCIGATTFDEYRKYIESDAALERRFQPVMVEEPSIEQTIAILARPARRLRDAITASRSPTMPSKRRPQLSARYIADRFLPDKAIDLIDEAAASVALANKGARRRARRLRANDVAAVVTRWTGIPQASLTESQANAAARSGNACSQSASSAKSARSRRSPNAIRRARAGLARSA